MPNFNGAIVVHTLQLIKTPATLREIVGIIAKNTDLSTDELMKPVKQTLETGHRMGYLQKLNGRYFLLPMSFETLMAETKLAGQQDYKTEVMEKLTAKPKLDKKTTKLHAKPLDTSKKSQHKKDNNQSIADPVSSTTLTSSTLMPSQSIMLRKPKRSQN